MVYGVGGGGQDNSRLYGNVSMDVLSLNLSFFCETSSVRKTEPYEWSQYLVQITQVFRQKK